MAPGWIDTFAWIQIANSLGVGPGTIGLESPMSELSLPSYCPGAGYPQYVRVFLTFPSTNSRLILLRFLIYIRVQISPI